MTEIKVKVELLSDMCCGTGEGNGSNIDMLTAFDECGLPVIPAKRLKGLLKECGRLLENEGYKDASGRVEKLFGGLKGKEGLIRVTEAETENADVVRAELTALWGNQKYAGVINSEAVQSCFCTLRSQTSINEEGTAKDHSLRTIQTVNKGTVFYFSIFLSDSANSADIKFVETCVKILRNIGMNKSRGFGEVRCFADTQCNADNKKEIVVGNAGLSENVTHTCKITLLQDMVLSSGSNQNPDYISGAMLMGAFAKLTAKEGWFKEVVLKKTVFSNAYISDGKSPFYPTPLYCVSVKNNDDKVFSLADGYKKSDAEQYVGIGGYSRFEDYGFNNKRVESAYTYHHSTKNSDMGQNPFTLKKLLSGQTFIGSITAPQAYIDVLRKVLENNSGALNFGGSASAQYSRCKVEISDKAVEQTQVLMGKEMIVDFLSDMIIVDQYGQNTSNIESLKDTIKDILKFENAEVYSKPIVIGGFNAKWMLPKRQYVAFAKGSALKLTGCAEGVNIEQTERVGLMQNEGFGEIRIRPIGQNEYSACNLDDTAAKTTDALPKASADIVDKIKLNYALEKIRVYAMQQANEQKSEMSASCSMRLLKEYQAKHGESAEAFKARCEKDFEQNDVLKKFALDAINVFDKFEDIQFSPIIDKSFFNSNSTRLFDTYIFSFISQLKRNNQKGDKEQ